MRKIIIAIIATLILTAIVYADEQNINNTTSVEEYYTDEELLELGIWKEDDTVIIEDDTVIIEES